MLFLNIYDVFIKIGNKENMNTFPNAQFETYKTPFSQAAKQPHIDKPNQNHTGWVPIATEL